MCRNITILQHKSLTRNMSKMTTYQSSKGGRGRTEGTRSGRGAQERMPNPAEATSRTNPKLPDGLIMISGYHENGVDLQRDDFRRFTNVWETFLRTRYPKLVETVHKPFGKEPEVDIPAEIKKNKFRAYLQRPAAKIQLWPAPDVSGRERRYLVRSLPEDRMQTQ